MALRVHFERPTTQAEVDREVERLKQHQTKDAPADFEVRRYTRAR